jgi:hypothetical protein
MVMSRRRDSVQRLPSLSCPNVMPCRCERLKVRLTTVPLNAALLRVSRSDVVSGRNEQKIGPRGQARRRWLGQRNDPYRDRRGVNQ